MNGVVTPETELQLLREERLVLLEKLRILSTALDSIAENRHVMRDDDGLCIFRCPGCIGEDASSQCEKVGKVSEKKSRGTR